MRWLDRSVSRPGPYLCLCLNQREFDNALRHCKIDLKVWLNRRADATTHFFDNDKGERVCVVCLAATGKQTGAQIAALLVHEAVHIWQEFCEMIGERYPASEQQAYGIQAIAQTLMEEYARRVYP